MAVVARREKPHDGRDWRWLKERDRRGWGARRWKKQKCVDGRLSLEIRIGRETTVCGPTGAHGTLGRRSSRRVNQLVSSNTSRVALRRYNVRRLIKFGSDDYGDGQCAPVERERFPFSFF